MIEGPDFEFDLKNKTDVHVSRRQSASHPVRMRSELIYFLRVKTGYWNNECDAEPESSRSSMHAMHKAAIGRAIRRLIPILSPQPSHSP